MSINVTVSGNPVRISRGKMVTSLDPMKAEFEKRRLMRLEQVRQQSKDIAESVRNKVRKEKSKQLSQIEKDGEDRLKNWQARKLLELQNQYMEALDEIGLGHKDAARVELEEEAYFDDEDVRERVAEERGRQAAQKLQIGRNEESLKRAVPIQRKKLTRDEENNRSSTVVKKNQKKSPFKKKKKQQVVDSDSENRVPRLEGLGDDSDRKSNSDLGGTRRVTGMRKTSKEQQTSPNIFEVPTSDKAAQTNIHDRICTSGEIPYDTRISDRIRHRALLNPEDDYCNFVERDTPKETKVVEKNVLKEIVFCPCCQCHNPEKTDDQPRVREKSAISVRDESRSGIHTQYSQPELEEESQKQPRGPQRSHHAHLESELEEESSQKRQPKGPQRSYHSHLEPELQEDPSQKEPERDVRQPRSKPDIPSKPKVTLTSTKNRPAYIETHQNPPKVQFYDHPNRYSKSYVPKGSHVEKIDDDNIVISPNILNEEEIREKMRQRDREAHLRGQVALEKERIQREYRDLMKKLPVLQKQERIAEIGLDKEKYHMSTARLDEFERKRQNRLDNAYEELVVRPRPATVTLPKKTDSRDEHPSLNLAWDSDFQPKNTTNQARTDQLGQLLSTLKSQKNHLLKEIENTLSKQGSTQFDDIKSKSTDYPRRKRSRDERPTSPTTSDILPEESTFKTKSKKGSISATSAPSPRKKRKTSRKVLIRQNTSTQTTPKTGQSVATSPHYNTPEEVCSCKKKDSSDDVCEVVIKIKEGEKPEVVVAPPYSAKSVSVVSEVDAKSKDGIVESKRSKDESKDSKRSKDETKESKRSKDETKESKKGKDETKSSKEASWRSKDESKATSWREQFSRSGSSSSTSYLDPPLSGKSDQKGKKMRKSQELEELSKIMDSTVSSNGSGKLNANLVAYIKKLLNMSRRSIDDLTVSGASDVSTPSHSVVEMPTNNPLAKLLNVMKYYNLDVADLEKQLSYGSDESGKHYNTSESVAISSSTSEGDKTVQYKSCVDINSSTKIEPKKIEDYANMTASCTEKISQLTSMIAKLREEKKKMMSSGSSSSDKDLTLTSYKQLPNKDDSSPKEENLYAIDYGYAEKLKQLSQEELQIQKKQTEGNQLTDDELLSRLKRLLQNDTPKTDNEEHECLALTDAKKILQEKDGKSVTFANERKIVEERKDGKGAGLVSEKTTVTLKSPETQDVPSSFPLFLDIPKLPRLEAPSIEKKRKKRPPPTRPLHPIKESVIPHELSTIIEADSQLSGKTESPAKAGRRTSSPKSRSRSPSPKSRSSSSESKSGNALEVTSKDKSMSNSSDDISEMETMETMLQSIGMDWAVPTLKKTREALALTSSSSGSKESGELSLREFLSKISSSSAGTSMSDSHGMSVINEDQRMTSTPIPGLGEKKDGEVIFSPESDLSSVKENSDKAKDIEQRFFEMSDLQRSKEL